jgi:ABC-type multidrug transport system fused ATPase/permease subunit
MSTKTFVAADSNSRTPSQLGQMRRLASLLPLLLCLLPVSLALNFIASSSPSVFRWYAGRLAERGYGTVLPWFGQLELTVAGLFGLAVLATLVRILAWVVFEMGAQWSAQRIYALLVQAVARTRTTYFDENPSGRMINRMVGDYNQLRTVGLTSINDTVNAWIDLLSILLLTLLASWYGALLIAPLIVNFYYLQGLRTPMVTESRMLSSSWSGKVLDRHIDLIGGRSSYLLYGRFDRLVSRLGEAFDGYARALMTTIHIESVFNMYVRLSIECYVVLVMSGLAMGLFLGELDPALAGVVMSALFAVNGSIGYLEASSAQMARQSAHTSRVFEYIDLLPEEVQEHSSDHLILSAAQAGVSGLCFEQLTVSYRNHSPIILRDFSLQIEAGQKVGLIGRSGSGKTSIIQALFRMMYVHGGNISVDGRSLYEMSIQQARRLFGVVPQDPYLFEGTLRSNLDRRGELSDETLLLALKAVELDLPFSLMLQEGGSNLSLGQRQLLCLARVIAAGKDIVLLDEATSGLDPETDARIQVLLTTALRHKTVITVAHRRESLRNYDLIVELDDGTIIRQGSPASLLTQSAPAY